MSSLFLFYWDDIPFDYVCKCKWCSNSREKDEDGSCRSGSKFHFEFEFGRCILMKQEVYSQVILFEFVDDVVDDDYLVC